MHTKLNDYFKLVDLLKQTKSDNKISDLKNRLKGVKRALREKSRLMLAENVNMSELASEVEALKKEEASIKEAISASIKGGVVIKKKIAEERKMILSAPHREDWDAIVSFFKKNPVALTSVIHQTGYEQEESVKALRSLPFRGRISGPYGLRYKYEVELEDGSKRHFSSVNKIVASLDRKNELFKGRLITFSAFTKKLRRHIMRIDGLKIVSITR